MPGKKEIKVIIDTNLFISFLVGKRLSGLKEHLVNFRVRLLFSKQILEELDKVTKRPKLQKYFNDADVIELINLVKLIGEEISTGKPTEICRNPKDDFLLDIAARGNANYLITGDHDLLEINKYRKTKIISYLEFEKILAEI